jgi:hypothetical protein
MHYSYEIVRRPVELGGGWGLRLLQDGILVGGRVFPIEQDKVDPCLGVAWWHALGEEQHSYWLKIADSSDPADAYHTFLLAQAYAAAEREAHDWLKSSGAELLQDRPAGPPGTLA